mmetsp:Transcript_8610/g.12848  ORF Transcript_8610/g.12848 Transcript_8610/m.12848 type:complete len:197 (-) Transcript_8610:41-631(-)
MEWYIGTACMIIAFACSFLFWSWYSQRNKNEEEFNFQPDDVNNNADPAAIDKLFSKNDGDVLAGETKNYSWTQNDKEVEVYVKVEDTVRGKDVKCEILPDSLSLSINGELLIDGYFYANVIPDECNWQIDGDGAERRVWISLYKETPTTRNQHWKCVLEGDEEIDVSGLGPPVHHIDVNDKNSLHSALDKVSRYKK